MPSELRHLYDNGQPYPVVRLIGVLDAGTAPKARAALLDNLAEQPEALIIDVFEVSSADPGAVGVLGEVARETADWPGAHLAICAPGGEAVWQTSGLPVWPSLSQAFTALGQPDEGRRLSTSLDAKIGAARRARELITEACARWELPELAGPGSIVVTEMVNNVVAHAHTPMTVRIASRPDGITVAVRDHCVVVPRFTGPVAPTSYGGRGLLLIDSVARRWGNLVLPDGKVVWAVLHREDELLAAAPVPAPAQVAEQA